MALVAAWFFGCTPASADDVARVIPLRHRLAQEIIPLLRPLLGPNDAISGADFRLVVRTSNKNLKEIERVLAQIDVAQRRLSISVRQVVLQDKDNTTHGISGEARVGKHARIELPDRSADNTGLTVRRKNNSGSWQYQGKQTTTASRVDNTQSILTLDGERAYIRIGQSIPHIQRILTLTGNQAILTQGVTLQNVTTGFEVLPRIRGEQVLLEITPRLSTIENSATGSINFQELRTTVNVKLGEWIDLGQIAGANNETHRAILESGVTRTDEHRTILLKVESSSD